MLTLILVILLILALAGRPVFPNAGSVLDILLWIIVIILAVDVIYALTGGR